MKVIVAIDDSPYSQALVAAVTKRAWPKHTVFKLVTVLEPIAATIDDGLASAFSDTLAAVSLRRKRAAQERNKKICLRLGSVIDGAKATSEIREGQPRQEILNAAVDWSADLILVGAHGRDVCPTNSMGSVSRAVASHAPCSVEVIRPPRQLKAREQGNLHHSQYSHQTS